MDTLDPNIGGDAAHALEKRLRDFIVGQEEAVLQIVDAYQVFLAGLNAPHRPVTSLLFLGPTGSGKTRIVEVMAECLFGTARAVLKIDCGEYQHSHEIAKLVGSPPGYLGHRETSALLSQSLLDKFHTRDLRMSLVLFDEIEKASDALWNLLLGIMDKATLTLGDNRRVDFTRTMIFMTSNLGAAEVDRLSSSRLGFARSFPSEVSGAREELIRRKGMEAAQQHFAPEFINRFDKIVVFKPLGACELRSIMEIELDIVQRRILEARNDRRFLFSVTDAGKQFLLDEGTDARYGARFLKRAIERLIVQPISRLIASEQIRTGDRVYIDHLVGSPTMTFGRVSNGARQVARERESGPPVSCELARESSAAARQERRPVLLSELGSVRYLCE